jgi:hypothetical protein
MARTWLLPLGGVVLLFAACKSQPPLVVAPVQQTRIEGLIDQLQEVDGQGPGFSIWYSGSGFIGTGRWRADTGVLFRPPVQESDPLVELVRAGLDALPQLLEHVFDSRLTKLTLNRENTAMNRMFEHRFPWLPLTDPAPEWESEPSHFLDGDSFDEHTVCIGDLCYVAIGQIVHRNYDAIWYVPSGNTFASSPVKEPRLADEVVRRWTGLTPAAHCQSLIDDIWINRQGSAFEQLEFYYPDVARAEIRRLLQTDPYEDDLVHECITALAAESSEAGLRKLFRIQCNSYGAAVRGGIFRELRAAVKRHYAGRRVEWEGLPGAGESARILDCLFPDEPDELLATQSCYSIFRIVCDQFSEYARVLPPELTLALAQRLIDRRTFGEQSEWLTIQLLQNAATCPGYAGAALALCLRAMSEKSRELYWWPEIATSIQRHTMRQAR